MIATRPTPAVFFNSTGVTESANVKIDVFRYDLDHHLGLDKDAHGAASVQTMPSLCGDNDWRWRVVQRAAEEALMARITLWDRLAEAIEAAQ
jgi:hypothetical protein